LSTKYQIGDIIVCGQSLINMSIAYIQNISDNTLYLTWITNNRSEKERISINRMKRYIENNNWKLIKVKK